MSLLQKLVASPEFFDKYWQREPLHVERQDRDFYKSWFCPIRDGEELWVNAMRFSEDGTLMYFVESGKMTLPNPFFAFIQGSSVVVNKADRCSRAIHSICKRLQETFPFVYTNVYLTPAMKQTVPKHSDDREVLILQVFGSKKWRLYDRPVEFPYKDEEVGKGSAYDSVPSKELLLNQGDLLYIPRGVVHDAEATGEASMHLTVALQTSDWDYASMIHNAMANVLRSHDLERSRSIMPMTLLKPGDHDRSVVAEGDEKYRSVVGEAMTVLEKNFESSLALFHERIAKRSEDRDRICEGIKPAPFGLRLESRLMWNRFVKIEGIMMTKDDRLPTVTHVVKFSRKSSDGSPMNMVQGCSERICAAIEFLSKEHTKIPVAVSDLPLATNLEQVFLAYMLVNNCACTLVSV